MSESKVWQEAVWAMENPTDRKAQFLAGIIERLSVARAEGRRSVTSAAVSQNTPVWRLGREYGVVQTTVRKAVDEGFAFYLTEEGAWLAEAERNRLESDRAEIRRLDACARVNEAQKRAEAAAAKAEAT